MATAKTKKAADGGETGTYKVLSNVHHDGEPYAPGEDIVLDGAAAKPLLEAKAIEALPAAKKE